jgi:hypothetical protein
MYWRIWDLWGPAKLVGSLVTETEAILHYLLNDIGIVYAPPNRCPSRYRMEDVHHGDVGPDLLFDRVANCVESWVFVTIHVSFC